MKSIFATLLICFLLLIVPSSFCLGACYEFSSEKTTPHNGWGGFSYSTDLNGDGWVDVIYTGFRFPPLPSGNVPIKLFINDGNGNFSDQTRSLIIGPEIGRIHPRDHVVADFNGDGRPDIFIGCDGYEAHPWAGEMNVLLLSTEDGQYWDASETLPQDNDFSHSVAAGDIDNDGDPDIFVGNIPFEVKAYFLINNGRGEFQQNYNRLPASLQEGRPDTASIIADMNNDGKQDLIVGMAAGTPPHVPQPSMVFYNDGRGFFSDSESVVLPYGIFGTNVENVDLLPIDINQDGRLDLIQSQTQSVPWYEGRNIQVLIQTEDGDFTDETGDRITAGDSYKPGGSLNYVPFVLPIDFNNDGHMDLMLQGSGSMENQTIFLLNDGTGHFREHLDVDYFVGTNPERVFRFQSASPIPLGRGEGFCFFTPWSDLNYIGDNDQARLHFQTLKPCN